jgi:hypothetical protein
MHARCSLLLRIYIYMRTIHTVTASIYYSCTEYVGPPSLLTQQQGEVCALYSQPWVHIGWTGPPLVWAASYTDIRLC